jgi:Sugar kinases, ribokinase family
MNPTRASKIVTLGSATQDVFIRCEDVQEIHLHTKVDVQELHTSTGGGATNTAVAFKRLGFEVTTFFKISDDQAGHQIMYALAQENIHVPIFTPENFALLPTGTSFITPTPDHEWRLFVYRGANTEFDKTDIDFSVLHAADCVYIAPLTGPAAEQLPDIVNAAYAQNRFIAINPGRHQLINHTALHASLHAIDLVIMNAEEAHVFYKAFTGKELASNWRAFFDVILACGPQIAIVTSGAHGVYVATESTIYFHPSLPIKPTNTVGAGDSFGATFTACLLQNKSIEDAIIYGIINSASVLVNKDAQAGLLTPQEIDQRILAIHRTQLQVL